MEFAKNFTSGVYDGAEVASATRSLMNTGQ